MKYNFRKLFGKEAIICTLTILWVLLVSLGLTYGCFMVTMADHSFTAVSVSASLCSPSSCSRLPSASSARKTQERRSDHVSLSNDKSL